ncbi:MAG: hypothetical protein JSS83_06735, partial [Cyanobacteria bacterium SZAS LIN-3]|nr:hypothetical protein [Cyanobacteria bacterium SZAS LIN-3]
MDNGNTSLSKFTRRQYAALVALFVLFASIFIVPGAVAQTTPAPPGQVQTGGGNGADLSQGAAATQNTVPDPYYNANQYTTLVQQQAEQNTTAVAQNVEQQLWPDFGAYNDTYDGLSAFWGDDIISNLFSNIGQLIGKWLSEFINGWVADAVQFLTGFLRVFVLNPNIAVNGLGNGNGPADDISPYIRQGADVMYGIAVDLLLLLFVLCIWKYWAEAAWRGGGNMMGAVGRLIFTAGLLLAWPTIYAFEIQISNEMIKAIYFNSADQVAMLDAAMAAAVKGGLVAGAGLLANATAPVAGQVFGGALGAAGGAGGPLGLALGTVGSLVAFVGLIVYLVLGGILIAELIYILVLKSIQTALLCAQYMFAPLFLVFFAVPDTENVTSGFVKSFVEVSLWTFVWVGMLKILVIVVLSNFNPWGKIVMAVGVLQLMIQVPSFLARAQISPMSDFISAGLVTGGLLKGGSALGNLLSNRAMHFANAVGNFGYAGAKGAPKSQATELNGLANDVARPDLLKDIRSAQASGQVPGAKGPGDGKGKGKGDDPNDPTGQKLNPVDPNAPKGPKDGKDDPTKTPGPPGKDLNGAKGDLAGGVPGANPKAGDAALGTPAGAPGDKNLNAANPTPGDALANAGKNAALGVGLGAAAGAGLAAVESGAALKNAAQGTGAEGDRSAAAAQQQAAEALKKMENLKEAGADGSGVKGPVGPDGKPLKVNGGTIADGAGPTGGKDKAGLNVAGAVADPTVSSTLKGAVGGKGVGATGANEADAKGKDLNALNPNDVKAPTTATNAGATGAEGAKGQGQQLEMEFERDGDKAAVAAASVAGLGGPPKVGELKDQTDGKGGKDGSGPTGGKQVVSGGTLNGAGAGINGAGGATTDVSAKLVPKKPGEVVSGKTVAPSLATTGLNTAVSASGTGKNIDPTTGMGTTDVVHDESDPGAPITTPSAKTEVHTAGSAAKLTGAAGGGADAKIDAKGNVISAAGTPPPNPNNVQAGQQGSLPLTGGKMNTDVSGKGANLNPTLTTTSVTGAVRPGSEGAQPQGIINTELTQDETGATGVGGANATLNQTVRTNAQGGVQPTAQNPTGLATQNVQGGLVPPVNPNANLQPGQQMSLPFGNTGKMNTDATTGKGANLTPGATTSVTGTVRPGGDVAQPQGIVNTELQEEMTGAGAPGTGTTVGQTVVRQGQTVTPGGNQQNVQTNATGKVVTGVPGGTQPPPITNVSSQFTQASGGKGSAPGLSAASAVPPTAAGGGAAGGGGGNGGPPPIFDHDNNPEGPAGTTPPAGEAGMGSQPASNRTQGSMYDGYMQAGYRHVPYRVAAAAIRLAQGATLAPSRSGKPEIIQDNQGHMMHVRFGEGATDEQKAMQIMSGAYGELMSTDAEAYDAARQSSIDAGEHKPVGM